MKKIIHVNQHVIRRNTKQGTDEPVLTDADWFPMLTSEQLAAISGDRERDINLQRPQLRNWMENLPEGLQPARKDS